MIERARPKITERVRAAVLPFISPGVPAKPRGPASRSALTRARGPSPQSGRNTSAGLVVDRPSVLPRLLHHRATAHHCGPRLNGVEPALHVGEVVQRLAEVGVGTTQG
jgi:hypothetical protein